MPVTPDQTAQGYQDLSSPTATMTAPANGTVSRYTGSNPTMGAPSSDPTASPAPTPAPTAPVSTPSTVPTASPSPAQTNPNPTSDPNYTGSGSNSILDLFNNLPTSYPTATDEANIRSSIAGTMQASVDAINKNYNDLLQTNILPATQQNTGATRASVGRSGLLDSDYGNAEQQNAQTRNQTIEDQAQADRESKLSAITDQINQRSEAEIQAKQAAALGDTEQLANYTQQAQTAARQNIKDLASIGAVLTPDMKASLLKDSGYDPMTFDAVFNANRQQSQQAQYDYTSLGNGTVLRTGKTLAGQALPNQTFQYQLGPNDDFQVTQNGTPLIITKNGNQITNVQVAPGFNEGDLASKFQVGTTYPGASNYEFNSLTGQVEPINTSAPSGGTGSGSGGFPTGAQTPGSAAAVNNPMGLKDPSTGQFQQFATPDAGFQAGMQDLMNKISGNTRTGTTSNSTLLQLSQAWKGTGNNDAQSWANSVAQIYGGGVSPSTPIGQLDPQKLAAAVAQHETGYTTGGSTDSGSATPKPYDPTDPTDALARTWLQSGTQPPRGNGKTGPTVGAVEARGRELATQFGLPSDFDPTTASASQKADVGALVDLTEQQTNTQKSLETVNSNAQLLLNGMKTAGINQNAPFINELQNAANNKLIGSGDLVAYQNSLNTLQSEYAKLLMGRGVTTDKATGDAQAALPANISASALQVVIQRIQSEGQNVLASLNDTISQKKQDITGIGGNAPSSSGSNLSYTLPDGSSYSFPDQASLDNFKKEAGLQ